MKARLATVLSLTGVLIAGSAAALVNTQVLSATPSAANNDTVLLADSTTVPTATLPGVTLPTATTVVSALSQAVYQIGDAGLVTLDSSGDQLTITSSVPNAGWTVVTSESQDPLNIEVKFQSSSTLVEFHANLLFGVVTTSVETQNIQSDNGSGGSSVTTPAGGSSGYSDDDGDDHGHSGEDEGDDD
jgi:hypothetical protein